MTVHPYPPEPEGTVFRWLWFPCGNPPEHEPAPMMATDRAGKPRDIRASLGMSPAGEASREDRVRWDPV